MDATIFDFDGVVVDSEPIHLAAFQQVLAPSGITMSAESYYAKYLGYDDRDAIRACAADQGVSVPDERLAELIDAKTGVVQEMFARGIEPLDGAVELIQAARDAGVPVAVCSGALRAEIEQAARAVGVWDCFDVVTAAEDVDRGKPDPCGYELTLRQLAAKRGAPLSAQRCVVVEDSPAGVDAAHAAGMRVLAVTNSYPPEALGAAECVVESLQDVDLDVLGSL
ncbi:MAG: HAD family hydrolase [Planctomycetota bacterium]